MKHKSLVALIMLLFIASFSSLGFAGDEISGKVSKVDGKIVSVTQTDGSVTKAEVEAGMELKEGDMVVVKDGKVIKKESAEKKTKRKVIEGC